MSMAGNARARLARFVIPLIVAVLPGWALSQSYPSKPVRIIIPAPPGGGIDGLARLLSASLAQELGGQPVTTENRGAASGIVGSEAVARSAPDGYTLLLGSNATFSINPVTFASLPYDPLKSFAGIAQISSQPLLLTVHPDRPVQSLADLVTLAKAQPGKLNYATTGAATLLTIGYLSAAAGMKMQDIPYQGLGPALPDAISGRVDVLMATIATTLPHVRSAKLRGIGITSEKRSSLATDIPSIAEQGYPGFDVAIWTALAAPAGTPVAVIDRLNAAAIKMLALPETREAMARQGIEPAPSSAAQLNNRIRDEILRWQKVAKEVGMKPQ